MFKMSGSFQKEVFYKITLKTDKIGSVQGGMAVDY